MSIRFLRPWTSFPIIVMVIGVLLVFSGVAIAEQPSDLHCPDGWVQKDDSGADDNDLVPDAGLLICVKAGSGQSNESAGNTGIIEADGVSTLRQYLFAAHITDGSGDHGRDVSYWVRYDEQASAAPTEEPTLEPTEEPTLEPTEEPTLEPTEVATASPTSTPGEGVLPGNPTPTPSGGSLPDTAAPILGGGFVGLGMALVTMASVAALAAYPRRRR